MGLLLTALLGVAGIGAGAAFFLPRTGTLSVYVSGPNGRDIGPVDVYVDKQKACTSSPCSVPELQPGIHDVYAEAQGYVATATKGVEVVAGKQAKFDIELFEAVAGFKVGASQPGITLYVDGKEVGRLPQTLTTLAPGDHKLRFVGSDRYAPLSRTVTVTPNRVEDLGDIVLNVVKGVATLELVTTGTRMRLVPRNGEARVVDEAAFDNGRLSIEIDTSKEWKLEACAVGYEPLQLPIEFAGGQAERTFRVELVKNVSMVATRLSNWCRNGARATPATAPAVAAATPAAANQASGTLSFNSVPPSAAVVLDGRPVGRTPMSGITVQPGTHSVVFIHPEKGRKATSVAVGAGQRQGVGVRF